MRLLLLLNMLACFSQETHQQVYCHLRLGTGGVWCTSVLPATTTRLSAMLAVDIDRVCLQLIKIFSPPVGEAGLSLL